MITQPDRIKMENIIPHPGRSLLRIISLALLLFSVLFFSQPLRAQESQADTSLYYCYNGNKIFLERAQEELTIVFNESASVSNAIKRVSKGLDGLAFTIDESQFDNSSILKIKLRSRLTPMVGQNILKRLTSYDIVNQITSLRGEVHLDNNEYSSVFYGGTNLTFRVDTNHILSSFTSPESFQRFKTIGLWV